MCFTPPDACARDGLASVPAAMTALPKAVDRFGPELLSLSWADLGNEESRFLRKQGGMRALAALAHASMTSKPGVWGG